MTNEIAIYKNCLRHSERPLILLYINRMDLRNDEALGLSIYLNYKNLNIYLDSNNFRPVVVSTEAQVFECNRGSEFDPYRGYKVII